jgi:hypothetical protein
MINISSFHSHLRKHCNFLMKETLPTFGRKRVVNLYFETVSCPMSNLRLLRSSAAKQRADWSQVGKSIKIIFNLKAGGWNCIKWIVVGIDWSCSVQCVQRTQKAKLTLKKLNCR